MVLPIRSASNESPVSPVRCAVSRANSGQCHRYTPYEMRPSHTSGANAPAGDSCPTHTLKPPIASPARSPQRTPDGRPS